MPTVASRVAANARTLTHARRSLWHRRLLRHTHTSTHLNVPNLGVLNPWSICTPGLLCSNLDPSPKAQAPLRARQGAVDEISRFRPDRHPQVNFHKQPSPTWRQKPTNTPGIPGGDYPHTPVPPPGTSHTRRGPSHTNTPPPPCEQLCNRYCSNKHTHRYCSNKHMGTLVMMMMSFICSCRNKI